jgi:uncharacterized membrane-anchored protein
MQQVHLPSAGMRYWAALCMASIFGANCGDFVARYFKLGHAGGLLPLAVLLAIVLIAERRDRSVHQAWYWTAIIIIRTAATNIGDFGQAEMGLPKLWLIAGLAALLCVTLVVTPPTKSVETVGATRFQLPTTDAKYWTAMLIAGTLGTVMGDFMSFGSGFGTATASIIQSGVLAVLFLLGARGLLVNLWFYWLTVVTVRAAGTSVGDFTAHNVGLPASTLVTGVVFVALLLLWKETPRYRLRSGEAV